jgi:RNA polymerase sigma-70 factor (ECF subfamily)
VGCRRGRETGGVGGWHGEVVRGSDEAFAAERPRLLGLAYRILSSYGDAEDVVQEAWIRWQSVDHGEVDNLGAYLTTVVVRLALDRARTISRRRERYVGPWLPEPIATERGPEEQAEMAESLTLGFLMMLDRLNPMERAVWLLADVFAEPYALISEVTGKSEVACRQTATRARRRLREERPAPPERLDARLLERLMAAVAAGDLTHTLELLDTDVVLLSDGGPGRKAARRPVVGANRVARFAINLARRGEVTRLEATEINGSAALLIEIDRATPLVITGEQRDGKVTRIFWLLNDEKLNAVGAHPIIC